MGRRVIFKRLDGVFLQSPRATFTAVWGKKRVGCEGTK